MFGDSSGGAAVRPVSGLTLADAAARRSPKTLAGRLLPLGCIDASGLSLAMVDGQPVMPQMTAARSWQLSCKRVLDIVASLTAIVVLLPLLVAVAIAIALTSQ